MTAPPLPSDCEHATEPRLRRFYWWHPELLCGRCWFAGRPVLRRLDGGFTAFLRDRGAQPQKGQLQ